MKKALALILALAVMLSLAACGQKDTPKADEQTLGTEEVGSAADKYPEKAVKIIIPYGAGGSTDMGGRVVASCLPGFQVMSNETFPLSVYLTALFSRLIIICRILTSSPYNLAGSNSSL